MNPNDRYLVVYELIPDEIQFYSVPVWEVNASKKLLDSAHGKVVNVDAEADDASEVCGILNGSWAKYRLHVDELRTNSFVGVYYVGFML